MMNMTQEIKPGDIVMITKGRGEGRAALVIGMTDTGRARIADGRRIRVDRPKEKSCKHLRPMGPLSADAGDWSQTSNRAVRSIIRRVACGIIEQEGLFCQRMT